MPTNTPLTVKDLIHDLKLMPPGAFVILSSDEEGNDFNPFGGIDPEATWDLQTNDITDGTIGQAAIVLFPEHG